MSAKIKKYSRWDFSEENGYQVEHNKDFTSVEIRRPDTIIGRVKLSLIDGKTVITGDFGNWIACREFKASPDSTNFLDPYYFLEKLQIHSTQVVEEFDEDGTKKKLKELVSDDLYEEDLELIDELVNLVDDSRSAEEYNIGMYSKISSRHSLDPYQLAAEMKPKPQVLCIVDAFNEILIRLRREADTEVQDA